MYLTILQYAVAASAYYNDYPQSQFNAFGESPQLLSSSFGVPGANASYDYVVIGGGTAGITIASRLAEDPSVSVAIIEAGGFYEIENSNRSVVPGYGLAQPVLAATEVFPHQPLVDWGLVFVPQTGAGDRRIHYAQGKTLGGSSALNIMVYHRATNGTYQRWAELVDDEYYTFDDLLPYYMKTLQPPMMPSAKHPTPLSISWCNWVEPVLTWFQPALNAIGLPISDLNFESGILSGFSAWTPSSVSPLRAERSTSESSFLQQALRTTGIVVYTHVQARRILFSSGAGAQANAQASGVLVTTDNVNYTISARKEVILSAGAFHSPQLLMVSGIGPRSVLEDYQIPVISDLPGVGQNLWDQIFFGVINQVDIPTAAQLMTEPQFVPTSLQQYLENATGPFSCVNNFLAFEKIPAALRRNFTADALSALHWFPSDWPEVEYLAGSGVGANGTPTALLSAALVAPLSRGNVTIASADASVPPVIDMGWLTDPTAADAQVAVAAFKRVRQAWSTIQEIVVGPELVPGPTVQTDEEILAYIRQTCMQIWHAAATCAMGTEDDVNAVVDSSARVFGVSNLRVVDNSAMPFAVPGHPQATVYMLAEKIADLIKRGG